VARIAGKERVLEQPASLLNYLVDVRLPSSRRHSLARCWLCERFAIGSRCYRDVQACARRTADHRVRQNVIKNDKYVVQVESLYTTGY